MLELSSSWSYHQSYSLSFWYAYSRWRWRGDFAGVRSTAHYEADSSPPSLQWIFPHFHAQHNSTNSQKQCVLPGTLFFWRDGFAFSRERSWIHPMVHWAVAGPEGNCRGFTVDFKKWLNITALKYSAAIIREINLFLWQPGEILYHGHLEGKIQAAFFFIFLK